MTDNGQSHNVTEDGGKPRIRIVGYGEKPADQFMANPQNWRKHPEAQRKAVRTSLNTLGWVDTVIENVTTGHLIDGHERVMQALKTNEDVPFIQVELSPEEEELALATLDPLTGMAIADSEMLSALLRSVGETALVEDGDVVSLLSSIANMAGLQEAQAPDEFPEYDDDIDTDYCCPKCGYEWSGSPK